MHGKEISSIKDQTDVFGDFIMKSMRFRNTETVTNEFGKGIDLDLLL